MSEVEIYLEGVDESCFLNWLKSKFILLERLSIDSECYRIDVEMGRYKLPVIISSSIEEKTLTRVWFNSEYAPWSSDVECARDAFKFIQRPVLCDPSPEHSLPNIFFRISVNGENLVNIDEST